MKFADTLALNSFIRVKILSLITGVLALFSCPVFGQDRGDSLKAPQYLYHWAKLESANQLAASIEANPKGPFPLKRIGGTFQKQTQIWIGTPALYTWSHPVTGIAFDGGEFYGQVLIKLSIDKEKARILALTTADQRNDYSHIDFSQYDIVKHTHIGQQKFQEWIILNSAIITDFTGDPTELRKELWREVTNLNNPEYVYPLEVRHNMGLPTDPYHGNFWSYNSRSRFVLPRVISFLHGRRYIHKVFLSNKFSCLNYFKAI